MHPHVRRKISPFGRNDRPKAKHHRLSSRPTSVISTEGRNPACACRLMSSRTRSPGTAGRGRYGRCDGETGQSRGLYDRWPFKGAFPQSQERKPSSSLRSASQQPEAGEGEPLVGPRQSRAFPAGLMIGDGAGRGPRHGRAPAFAQRPAHAGTPAPGNPVRPRHYPEAASAARASNSERSRALRVMSAARRNSARASSRRPSLCSRSPRTAGSRW